MYEGCEKITSGVYSHFLEFSRVFLVERQWGKYSQNSYEIEDGFCIVPKQFSRHWFMKRNLGKLPLEFWEMVMRAL